LLHREGSIKLNLRPGISITKERKNRQYLALRARYEGVSSLAIFDLADFHRIGLPKALETCDFYFKRSLTEDSYKGLEIGTSRKLKPFGFNYQVVEPSMTLFAKRLFLEYVSRPYNPISKKNRFHMHNLKEVCDANMGRIRSPLLGTSELQPKDVPCDYDVLFQCRLWDPRDLDPINGEDSERVNEQRIAIIRQLKKNLGKRFVGGLQPSDYARKVAPELVIEDARLSQRRQYLSMVERSSIVVSSTGLLGSNGWKLGEYIALGKAIVSEPLKAEVPGLFSDGTHYESYTNPEDCIGKIHKLLSSPERLQALGNATSTYYKEHLSPKALMWNHLKTMLDR